jgi:membrane protease YdiL (CAAX protease family)
MNIKKYFQYDETRDFPYYNHNPHLSKKAWLALMLTVPIAYIVYIATMFNELISSILFCFIMLIPLLYFSKWDYELLFKKPTKNEILLALLMFIGYMTYAILMTTALEYIGVSSSPVDEASSYNIISLASLVFSMMGEELLKFIPLMFFMRLFYKISNRRNISFAMSSVLIMIFFGLLHYDLTSIANCLLLQGLGTVFELYGYYKTKNLLVPYLSHIFTDAFMMILIFIGI